MPTVSELKTEAERYQREGDPVGALAVYQEALQHHDPSSDAIAEELDVSVRVGDLRVELGQPARAFAAYRQAAELAARLGSATQVKALCESMINVVPAAGDAYVRCAGRLLAHGHVAAALDVLGEYARTAAIDSLNETLRDFAEQSDEEARSRLVELLATIDLDTQTHLLVAERVFTRLRRDAGAPAHEPSPRETVPVIEAKAPEPAVPAAAPEPAVPAEPEVRPSAPAAEGGESVVEPPPRMVSDSQAAFPVLAVDGSRRTGLRVRRTSEDRVRAAIQTWVSADPRRPYLVGGIGVAGVLVVAAIVAIARGGGTDSPQPPTVAAAIDTNPTTIEAVATDNGSGANLEPVATTAIPVGDPIVVAPPSVRPGAPTSAPAPSTVQPDTTVLASDSLTVQQDSQPPVPLALAAQPESTPPAGTDTFPSDSVPLPVQQDSTVAIPSTLDAVSDTTTPGLTPDTLPSATADSSMVIAQPIVVDGLTVQSVDQVEFRGQQGFRVVHFLDSGSEFVVESYPVDSTTARSYPPGTLIVTDVPPDTIVSIVRFDERHLVFASGVVPEDSLRVLIGLLTVREP